MFKKPELLAPAGNLSCALAAFDAGADAVYAGLDRFNARERGENFTLESMLELIEYAHERRKKVYLTLNTILKEKELDDAAEFLSQLYASPPDAVLVQDLGVGKMIKECFPEIELHASTQMGIHNLAGLQLAKKMGFTRVVLERQLTLEEITKLAAESPVELEVFIHGALCSSLSGECLLSSWSGGHSGNRGKCKQACRRRYFSKQGNGFFFSTADLCSIELIPELKNLNISSYKIEGRLRQADYVFNTVTAYRKLIDAETPDKKLWGEVRNLLSEACGRKWSNGFYSTDSMQTLIQHKSLGASGIPCGQIDDLQPGGFGFTASRRVHLGDRIRLQPVTGDEGPAMTITKMYVNRIPATVASAGDYCFVCCDKVVDYKALVYKIGRATAQPVARELPALRTKLHADFRFSDNMAVGKITNTVPPIQIELPITTAPAEKRALNSAQIAEELAYRSDAEYASGTISSSFDSDYFMPLRELKVIRNSFWEQVMAKLPEVSITTPGSLNMFKFHNLRLALTPYETSGMSIETVAISTVGATPGNPKARRASSIFSYNKKANEVILPDFCPPGREVTLKKLIAEAVTNGIRRFRVTSFYALALLEEYRGQIDIVSSHPLAVANSLAAEQLREMGVRQIQAQPELERSAMEQLIMRSPLPVEIYRFGRLPLLSTRAKVAIEGEIKDARGAMYMIVKDRPVGLTRLYSGQVLSIPRLAGTSDFYDLTNAHWGAKDQTTFNFNTELL